MRVRVFVCVRVCMCVCCSLTWGDKANYFAAVIMNSVENALELYSIITDVCIKSLRTVAFVKLLNSFAYVVCVTT